MGDTPALDWLLRDKDYAYPGPNRMCADCIGGYRCPFATLAPGQMPGDIANDPSEAYYLCSLLDGKRVWGESPKCTEAQWRARAREELSAAPVGAHFAKVDAS